MRLSHHLYMHVRNFSSLLDLGSGSGAVWGTNVPTEVKTRVAVDLFHPDLNKGLQSGVYTHAIQSDILTFLESQKSGSFDVVLAISVIEHLPTEAGRRLALEMKRVAKHLAIVFTPNGFVYQAPTVENPFQEHLSGWDMRQLKQLGYDFAGGFNGLKVLRTTRGLVRLRPRCVGTLCVLISARLTQHSMRFSFELLGIAKLGEEHKSVSELPKRTG